MSCVGLLDTDFTDRQSPHKYPLARIVYGDSNTVQGISRQYIYSSLRERALKAVVATSVLQLKFSIFPPDWRQI